MILCWDGDGRWVDVGITDMCVCMHATTEALGHISVLTCSFEGRFCFSFSLDF